MKLIRDVDNWTTIAVTALPPGWITISRYDDGTVEVLPCPALLLQECISRTEVWKDDDGHCHRRVEDEIRRTRVVGSFFGDCDSGNGLVAHNPLAEEYRGCATEDCYREHPDWFVSELDKRQESAS
jgi:hypothetical protein